MITRWYDDEGRCYKRVNDFTDKKFAEMLSWEWVKYGHRTKVLQGVIGGREKWGVFICP